MYSTLIIKKSRRLSICFEIELNLDIPLKRVRNIYSFFSAVNIRIVHASKIYR